MARRPTDVGAKDMGAKDVGAKDVGAKDVGAKSDCCPSPYRDEMAA
jgi:hypothetical protein